jgi:hypothetical protein
MCYYLNVTTGSLRYLEILGISVIKQLMVSEDREQNKGISNIYIKSQHITIFYGSYHIFSDLRKYGIISNNLKIISKYNISVYMY